MSDTFEQFLRKFATEAVNAYLFFDSEYSGSSEQSQGAAVNTMMNDYLDVAFIAHQDRAARLLAAVERLEAGDSFTCCHTWDSWSIEQQPIQVDGPTLADALIALGEQTNAHT